jgi:hypothetical protein
MVAVLSPTGALEQLIKLDPKAALPVVGGLALLAAAAIVTSWAVDIRTAGLMGLYILILGFVLLVAANVLNDPTLKLVLGWFLTILIMATVTVFFISAVWRQQGIIKPTYCLVEFWKPCVEAEAAAVARNAQSINEASRPEEGPLPPPPPVQVDSAKYRVFIHFAGLITRERIAELNQTLAGGGWRVQGRSGERLPSAQGLNEVRYSNPADRPAAEALAGEVTSSGLTGQPVQARQVDVIAPETFEVWISN